MLATPKVSRNLARGCPSLRGLPRVPSHSTHHFRAQRGERSEYQLFRGLMKPLPMKSARPAKQNAAFQVIRNRARLFRRASHVTIRPHQPDSILAHGRPDIRIDQGGKFFYECFSGGRSLCEKCKSWRIARADRFVADFWKNTFAGFGTV